MQGESWLWREHMQYTTEADANTTTSSSATTSTITKECTCNESATTKLLSKHILDEWTISPSVVGAGRCLIRGVVSTSVPVAHHHLVSDSKVIKCTISRKMTDYTKGRTLVNRWRMWISLLASPTYNDGCLTGRTCTRRCTSVGNKTS